MAVKTSAELKSQIDTVIKVNGNREITPPKHNSILTNVIDSYLNKSDGGVLSAMLSYSYDPSFTTDYQIIHKKYVDDAIAGLTTGLTYQGTWDANTNTPTIASGVGTNGFYYIVNVAGTTSIDGVNDWEVGDWILFNGTTWQKIDQSTKWEDGYPTYDLRYAKLDGSNQPFTGDIQLSAGGAFKSITIDPGGGLAYFGLVSAGQYLWTVNNAGAETNMGPRLSIFNIFSTGQIRFRLQNTSGAWLATPFYFDLINGVFQGIGASGVRNGIITDGSIKIANNTQTAATAGAGSLKYDSGFYGSDGANWNLLATSSDLSSYAKLDGSNQPFTGNVTISKTTGETFRSEATAGTNNIFLTGTTSVVLDTVASGASGGFNIRNWSNSVGGNQTMNFVTSIFGTTLQSMGSYSCTIGSQTHKTAYSSTSQNNQVTTLFQVQNWTNSKNLQWSASTGTLTNTGVAGALNSVVLDGGIKIANNTQTAAAAGAGSIRYNSGLEVSDGATWSAVGGGGGATDFAKETYSLQDITAGSALTGTAYYMKIVMSADVTVNRIGCFVTSTAAETIYMAIYNTAGTKLVEGSVDSGSVVAGVNVATIADTALEAGTEYWIAVKDNNTGSVNLGTKTTLADTNLCQSQFVGAGSLPASKGGTAASTSVYCYVAKV